MMLTVQLGLTTYSRSHWTRPYPSPSRWLKPLKPGGKPVVIHRALSIRRLLCGVSSWAPNPGQLVTPVLPQDQKPARLVLSCICKLLTIRWLYGAEGQN